MIASHRIVASEAFAPERFGARLASYRPAVRIEPDEHTRKDNLMLAVALGCGVVAAVLCAAGVL